MNNNKLNCQNANMSTRDYYERLKKTDIMKNPQAYAWNCILYYIQFTQEEIVQMKSYMLMPELVKYQKSVTREFLETHFAEEIDDCLEVDWLDVEKYVKN